MTTFKDAHARKCFELAAATILRDRIVRQDGSFGMRLGEEPDGSHIRELVCAAHHFKPDVAPYQRLNLTSESVSELVREPDTANVTAEKLLQLIESKERAYRRIRKIRFFLSTQISVDSSTDLPRRTKWNSATIVFYKKRPAGPPSPGCISRQLSALGIHEPVEGWYHVRVFVNARDKLEAANASFNALDELRALWNLELSRDLYSSHSSPTERPVNQIRLGPLQTVHPVKGESSVEQFWYQQPYVASDYPGRGTRLGADDLLCMREAESLARRRLVKNRYHDFIRSNLRNYVITLDAADHRDVFLKLWAVAESLTGCGQDGRMGYDRLITRAARVFSNSPTKKIVLSHLRRARNAMIHELRSDIRPTSMYQLLRIVHGLLEYHLQNCTNFRTCDESFEYLDLPQDAKKLRRQIQIRKYALRHAESDRETPPQ